MSLQNQQPFETSTGAPTDAVSNRDLETSPPSSQSAQIQKLIPLLLIGSGFATCAVLWIIAGNNTMLRVLGCAVFALDVVAALLLRAVFAARAKK